MGRMITFDEKGNVVENVELFNNKKIEEESDENYNFEPEIDEDEEHRLCQNELL